jgi:uncharacterized cupredoxin-like copper-binding protein
MRSSLIAALFFLAAPAAAQTADTAPADAEAAAPVVSVTLSNFDFTPKTVEMPASAPVVLHLVNSGSGGHNFAAPKFFKAAQVSPEDAAKVKGGKIELKKGESADIHLTTPAAGEYELHCSHFMHTAFGMKGKIVVG